MPTAPTDTARRVAVAAVLLAGMSVAGSAVAQLQWQQRHMFGHFSAPIAYDANRARLVLYAGGPEVPGSPETWEWDGVAWQMRLPAQVPPSRAGHALVHDLVRGRTVLFGGSTGSVYTGQLNDTWEWDGATWLAMQPATRPSARQGAAMVFDVTRGRVVLFGGAVSTSPNVTYFSDTWLWDGANWTSIGSMATPPARAWHGMSYDLNRGRVVLFGGENGSGPHNDTWEWDGTNWAQRLSPQVPSPRSHSALAFDIGRGCSVLFGGVGGGDETWEWDGTNWLQVVPPAAPPARSDAGLAYDVARGAVVMVGGYSSTTSLGDTWRWDGAQWTRMHGASSPSPRSGATVAWDRARSVLLLFGGNTPFNATAYAGDFWQWDGQRWLELQPPAGPSPRSGAAMVYDSIRGRTVLFGGDGGTVWSIETWEWDGATWRLAATAGPTVRINSAMAFDPIHGQAVLFGGYSTALLGDTWLWDGVVWRRRALALEPPPRYLHAMAFDERRGVVVLFGGSGLFPFLLLGDTWEWNGNAWLQRTPMHAPSARANHRLTWDAARERIVLFGGGVGGGSTLNDTWEWDGNDWQSRAAAPAPFARESHHFSFDRIRECAVLFGGRGSGANYADVWELAPVLPARVTSFGTGCAGTLGAPLLDVVDDRRPWLGDAVTLRVSPVVDGAVAMFALGSSNIQWNGAPLPAPLDGLGMPGCTLFVGLDETFAAIGSGGTALLTATVPPQPALLGMSLYLQGAVSDPSANAAGIVVSNALAVVIGAR